MSFKLYIFFVLAFWIIPQSGITQQDIRGEIEKLIRHETEWDKTNPSACVIAMIERDTIYYFNFDYSRLQSIKRHTSFEVGSITKLFVALFLEDQIKQGLINNDDLVSDILEIKNIHSEGHEITISDLKTHNTGLPKRPSFWGSKQNNPDQVFKDYTKNDLLEFYTKAKLKKEFSYSHINYAMIELVLDKIHNGSFNQIFNEFLKNKLGMRNSWLYHDQEKTLTPGYDRSGKQIEPYVFSSFASSEGLRTSCADLAKFIQNQINFGKAELVQKNSFEAEFNKDILFKYPWFKFNVKKSQEIYTFVGRSEGHKSQIFVNQKTKTAVVLMANGTKGIPGLAMNILRMMNQEWKRK